MTDTIIAQSLVEFIGTFIFITVILVATSKTVTGPASGLIAPIAIVSALFVAILFGGQISGGHFNPAVTFAKTIEGETPVGTSIAFISVQLLAAISAYFFYKLVHEKYTMK